MSRALRLLGTFAAGAVIGAALMLATRPRPSESTGGDATPPADGVTARDAPDPGSATRPRAVVPAPSGGATSPFAATGGIDEPELPRGADGDRAVAVRRFMAELRDVYADAGRSQYFDLMHSKIPTRALGVASGRARKHETPAESVASAQERFRNLADETGTSHRSMGLGTFHVACIRVGPTFETAVGWIRGGLEGGDDAMMARVLAARQGTSDARTVKDLSTSERAAFGQVLAAWRQDIESFKTRLWNETWPAMRSMDGGPSNSIVGIGGFGGALRAIPRGEDADLDLALGRLALLDAELESRLRDLVSR